MFRTTAVGLILAVTSVSAFAPISFGWLLLIIAACGIAPVFGAAASRLRAGKTNRAPLRPYPQVAVYNGSGSTDESAKFFV
jgi:hypothetical protein